MASAAAIAHTSSSLDYPTQSKPEAEACAMPASVPEVLAAWLRPFQGYFTAAIWRHALVLVAGAVLAPGRRTVTAALRVMGVGQAAGFAVHHRVLSDVRWSSRAVAHRLLLLLVAAFVPKGPVVVGLDDTIERRWGARITARGIYRDPVRSSRGHFVKASGLRWLCVMLLAPVPWAGCVWGLPFLTVLAPSERYAAARGRRHKRLTDWARQALLQVARWLPGRHVVAVADSSFSAIALLRDLAPHLCVVTRLRLDACLCEPPLPRRPGTMGRPPLKGARLPSLSERLRDPATSWRRVAINGWYGRATRRLDLATGTALWHHPGMRVAIRWVLVRDPSGEKEPQAFLCTDPQADPVDILRWFVRRWRTETTFEEARRHLGVESQRQWSDLAILRTTPALLGLFSLVTLWASHLAAKPGPTPERVRWYPKPLPTFSDALALVRRELWTAQAFVISPDDQTSQKVTADLLDRLLLVACRLP
jgi:DDE superfamily endonuclease